MMSPAEYRRGRAALDALAEPRKPVLSACERALVALALIAALLAVGGALASSADARLSGRCYEDEPCYVWSKTGDLKRGLILKGETRPLSDRRAWTVVGPCAFRRLDARGRIDWTRSEHLRGDWWARLNGCRRT